MCCFNDFKVCDSVTLSRFTLLCSHHYYLVQNFFITQTETPYPLEVTSYSALPQPLTTTNLLSISTGFPTLEISYK